MTDGAEVERAISLYEEIAGVLWEIRGTVMRADTERLMELVPRQEELLRRAALLRLPETAPPELRQRLQETALEAQRRNTVNAVLLQGQLGLIQATMQAILGDGRGLDRLA